MVFTVTFALFAGSIPGPTEGALQTVLKLERLGDAVRMAAVARFGPVEPLRDYRARPEGVAALLIEFERGGFPIPDDPYVQGKAESSRAWAGRLGVGKTLFETVEEAAKFEVTLATVYAELANSEKVGLAETMAGLRDGASARAAALSRFVRRQCCGG